MPALSNHVVVLHLGPPVDVEQKADGGRLSRQLVDPGDSAVVPAGVASEWRWGERGVGRADSLHLYLAPALIREAAEGVGVNPESVEIVGSLGSRDLQIDRIGRSLLPELEAEDLLGGGLFATALTRALAIHLLREHSSLGRSVWRTGGRALEGGLGKRAARLQAGESVLVQGAAGGVGSYIVQLAKVLGAGTVIGAAGSPERREAALALGADHVVDYTQADWPDRVRDLTGGRGADVVLEMAGGAAFGQSLSCLAPFGRAVVYGSTSGEPLSMGPKTVRTFFYDPSPNQSLIGFNLGHWFGLRPEAAVGALQTLKLEPQGR